MELLQDKQDVESSLLVLRHLWLAHAAPLPPADGSPIALSNALPAATPGFLRRGPFSVGDIITAMLSSVTTAGASGVLSAGWFEIGDSNCNADPASGRPVMPFAFGTWPRALARIVSPDRAWVAVRRQFLTGDLNVYAQIWKVGSVNGPR